MFKVKQYKDVLNYVKRTALPTLVILSVLTFGYCKTNFIISLISLYLMWTYMSIKILALLQSISVTEEKNIKYSWLTRCRFVVN